MGNMLLQARAAICQCGFSAHKGWRRGKRNEAFVCRVVFLHRCCSPRSCNLYGRFERDEVHGAMPLRGKLTWPNLSTSHDKYYCMPSKYCLRRGKNVAPCAVQAAMLSGDHGEREARKQHGVHQSKK